jgi:NAD(P)-dependent dehydrogenase (short-subunit alcohol dehydrogenase family)
VTGATSGIGEATARELARRGATVVVAGRNQSRCEATIAAIRQEVGDSKGDYIVADLSTLQGVRGLAREFRARHDRLHVLVNNVGALFEYRQESADGIEMTLALNHLGPFLLTHLLLDTLQASAPARIINVSSNAHRDVTGFDFDDPQAARKTRGLGAYGRSTFKSLLTALFLPMRHPAFLQYSRSKFANLLFTYESARRLEGSGVTANAVDPGFVSTRFATGHGPYGWFMAWWSRLFGIDAKRGAETPVYLATSAEVENTTGGYFVNSKLTPSSLASRDESAARRLWHLSEEWTRLAEAEPAAAPGRGGSAVFRRSTSH